ncbi:aryl-alcohol dehydrogenase [Hyaloscypha hepaticicola]|uniref:Aryl-alcohol dehydrogenase n=1 Tax=Hyaloscypha hepaticicola TaxID=2082293 RepID=A0A2J6QED3_9HELO|nr:aryl-alcohol dehydrogenase [Hyaloscypha hepaticicola]
MITEALLVQEAGAPFSYQEVTVNDNLRDDEVLVEMKATGVCHTDLNFSKEKTIPGLFPAIFGHEGAGIIVKTGPKVNNTNTGDHVILTYSCCGDCKYCHNQETSYCYDFEKDNFGFQRHDGSKSYSTKDGPVSSHFFGQSSFSKYAAVKAKSVVKIGKDLPLDSLAPLGCGIMTGAGAMLNVVKPNADSIVCVVGVGAVGLAALMALKLLPSPPKKIIAVDVVPERLELAKKYGATDFINSREVGDLKSALMDVSDGKGVDGTIDTTGRPEVVENLLEATAKKGIVVQVGVGALTADTPVRIFHHVNAGRQYVGCAMGSCYPQDFIPMLVEAWQGGKFPFTDLIAKYPAEDMNNAAKDVLSGKVIKAVLVWK